MNNIAQLNNELKQKPLYEFLQTIISNYSPRIAFATSLGLEDQVILHCISTLNIPIKIFTLDTGRMFYEIYELIERNEKKYNIKIETYFPNQVDVERMTNEHGINLFYTDVEKRKLCCNIRKSQPLKRALTGIDAWICGIRKQQSQERNNHALIEFDEKNNIIRINPLLEWDLQSIWNYIDKYNIPYNPLFKKGYSSIGCQPCTRPILPNEDARAGRWWWENNTNKECGLHSD